MEIPAVFPSPEALDSLLSPSLQQLYVRLPANRQRNDRSVLSDAFVKDVVQTIRAKLPKLDDFSLYFGHPTTSDTISTIVDSLSGRPFRRLSFKCWGSAFGPSPDVTSLVRFLSQVENLRDVTFTFNDKDMLPALPDEGGFATLETLELHGHATSMLQFVSLVQSSQLKRLGMDSAVTPVQKIGDKSVLKHCEQFKLLTSFEMNFGLVPTLMKFDDIRPLLKCSHLEIVVMYLPKFFGLNRHQLEAMLSSWPRLTRLALGEWDDGKEGRAKLTVLDLLLLSKYCPMLEELEICVNTDSLEAGLPHTLPPDWILPRLVTLDFRQSRVGEYGKDLARLIAHLWPNLKEVHVEWWPPESANWSRVWEEVEAITGNDLDESNRDFM
ncbi:hypothetical protein FRB99_004368 [Tulasnella sp. 403]|nr:hypothetical protein FRB99_004368 [Tulasnella sp. 403]